MLEVDLHTFEWRQPYFCMVQKERDSHGTEECTTSEEKNGGKRNTEGMDKCCQQKGNLANMYLFYGDMFY